MKQLVIKQEDIYKVEDIEYFKFQYNGSTYRDYYTDISKNNLPDLRRIAFVCELNYTGLKKKQLVELIEKSGCLALYNDD